MFTGKSHDLLKEAHAKAKAKDPPVTYLGSVPNEISAVLPELIKRCRLGDDMSWVVTASTTLLKKRNSNSRFSDMELKLVTCVFLIIQAAVRKRVSGEIVTNDLLKFGLPHAFASIVVNALQIERNSIEKSKLRYPRLENINWRVDMILSSSKQKRQSVIPTIQMKFTLSDGSVKRFEMSNKVFQTLRYTVAKILQIMNELEGHPMVKIMQVLENDQMRNL